MKYLKRFESASDDKYTWEELVFLAKDGKVNIVSPGNTSTNKVGLLLDSIRWIGDNYRFNIKRSASSDTLLEEIMESPLDSDYYTKVKTVSDVLAINASIVIMFENSIPTDVLLISSIFSINVNDDVITAVDEDHVSYSYNKKTKKLTRSVGL